MRLLPMLFLMVTSLALASASALTVGSDKGFRYSTSQGYVAFGSALTATGISRIANTMFTFSSPSLGGVSTWTSLGFASNLVGVNMTVTSILPNEVTYTTTGAGTQRVYVGSKGEPASVTGATSHSWDAGTSIYTVTTIGASSVKISWVNPPPPPVGGSGDLFISIGVLMSLMPLFFILAIAAALRKPKEFGYWIKMAFAVGVFIMLVWVLQSWGVV